MLALENVRHDVDASSLLADSQYPDNLDEVSKTPVGNEPVSQWSANRWEGTYDANDLGSNHAEFSVDNERYRGEFKTIAWAQMMRLDPSFVRFYRCSSIRASQNIALRASARYHTEYRTKSPSSVDPPVSSAEAPIPT